MAPRRTLAVLVLPILGLAAACGTKAVATPATTAAVAVTVATPATTAPVPITETPAPVTTPAPAPQPTAPGDELAGWLAANSDRMDAVSDRKAEMGRQTTAMSLPGIRATAKNLIAAIDAVDILPEGSEAGRLFASGLAQWREAATFLTYVTQETGPGGLEYAATLLRDGTDEIVEANTILGL